MCGLVASATSLHGPVTFVLCSKMASVAAQEITASLPEDDKGPGVERLPARALPKPSAYCTRSRKNRFVVPVVGTTISTVRATGRVGTFVTVVHAFASQEAAATA